jgi:hypothetical protein
MPNQIWNLEYIDLAHLLYKNFVSNIDKPKKVLGFGEDGDILVERSKYSKVNSVTNNHFQSVAPVVQLGVQEVYVVEEHFHCDGPEQEQADRQVVGHYHRAVEFEQGPHGLLLALAVLVYVMGCLFRMNTRTCHYNIIKIMLLIGRQILCSFIING